MPRPIVILSHIATLSVTEGFLPAARRRGHPVLLLTDHAQDFAPDGGGRIVGDQHLPGGAPTAGIGRHRSHSWAGSGRLRDCARVRGAPHRTASCGARAARHYDRPTARSTAPRGSRGGRSRRHPAAGHWWRTHPSGSRRCRRSSFPGRRASPGPPRRFCVSWPLR